MKWGSIAIDDADGIDSMGRRDISRHRPRLSQLYDAAEKRCARRCNIVAQCLGLYTEAAP